MDAIDAKRNNRYSVTLFLTTPIRSKITYYMYVGFCCGWVFPCSSSEQKPSLRQRHRLLASNAESRIRLIVLLTAPKIFAISSITDKNSCHSFARLSAWYIKAVKFKFLLVMLSMQSGAICSQGLRSVCIHIATPLKKAKS